MAKDLDKIVKLLSLGFIIAKDKVSGMPILRKIVAVELHTCKLDEVDGSALPYPLLSDSLSLEVFTGSPQYIIRLKALVTGLTLSKTPLRDAMVPTEYKCDLHFG